MRKTIAPNEPGNDGQHPSLPVVEAQCSGMQPNTAACSAPPAKSRGKRVPKISTRGYFDSGVAVVDYRGAVKATA